MYEQLILLELQILFVEEYAHHNLHRLIHVMELQQVLLYVQLLCYIFLKYFVNKCNKLGFIDKMYFICLSPHSFISSSCLGR